MAATLAHEIPQVHTVVGDESLGDFYRYLAGVARTLQYKSKKRIREAHRQGSIDEYIRVSRYFLFF